MPVCPTILGNPVYKKAIEMHGFRFEKNISKFSYVEKKRKISAYKRAELLLGSALLTYRERFLP